MLVKENPDRKKKKKITAFMDMPNTLINAHVKTLDKTVKFYNVVLKAQKMKSILCTMAQINII